MNESPQVPLLAQCYIHTWTSKNIWKVVGIIPAELPTLHVKSN